MEARKITYGEAWETASVFFLDEELENEIDSKVAELLATATDERVSVDADITVDDIAGFIVEENSGLAVILKDIGLSEEKFMRIISLLRRIGKIPGGFESEWGIDKVKRKIKEDADFAAVIADLLINGAEDVELRTLIPRYYLETLNYKYINGRAEELRRIRYKQALIGTYGGRKGSKVEDEIRKVLERLKAKYGVNYESGASRFIEVNVDFAVPSLEDPWVIIMSSFNETTSSGQTTKARDMRNAYNRIRNSNSRNKEDRAFVNFVDGGGWLARKSDFERLVEECHYFLNFEHLEMLEQIVKKHVPRGYFGVV